MLQELNIESFAQHLGDTFRCAGGGDEFVDLKLSEANGLSPQPGQSRAPFSLLFIGPSEPPMEQQTYTLQHEKMGELSLFLVPLGPGEDGFQYEAVFT